MYSVPCTQTLKLMSFDVTRLILDKVKSGPLELKLDTKLDKSRLNSDGNFEIKIPKIDADFAVWELVLKCSPSSLINDITSTSTMFKYFSKKLASSDDIVKAKAKPVPQQQENYRVMTQQDMTDMVTRMRARQKEIIEKLEFESDFLLSELSRINDSSNRSITFKTKYFNLKTDPGDGYLQRYYRPYITKSIEKFINEKAEKSLLEKYHVKVSWTNDDCTRPVTVNIDLHSKRRNSR